MSQELAELSRETYALPYGRAHSALLEQIVARADAEGAVEEAFQHRLRLAVAYSQGGEPRLSFAPFARCVADLDAEPDRFARFRYELLWGYKAIVHSMTYFPEIGLGQAEAMLDEMQRRYVEAGYGLHAVHQHRWLVAFHLGDRPAAEEHFRAWTTSPRDALADCVGCDPNDQVRHLAWVERHDEAVALGLDTLGRSLPCAEQPQEMQTALLRSLVAVGRLAEARDAHQRGYRTMRTLAAQLPGYAQHVRFATCTGNLGRAREIFERHVHELADPPQPYAAMEFQAVASRMLAELAEDDPAAEVADEHGVASDPEALARRYASSARALARRFDVRNGTPHQGHRVEELLAEGRWVEQLSLLALPIDLGRPRSETASPDGRVEDPAADAEERALDESEPLRDPVETETGALLDLVDDALRASRADVARSALDRFEAERPEPGRSEEERGQVAYARSALADDEGDDETTRAALRAALVHFDAAGDELRLNRSRASLGYYLVQDGDVAEAVATADDALAWLVEHDEPRRRPGWTLQRCALDRAAGRRDQAYDGLRELFATGAGSAERDEYVALMLTQDELARGRHVEAAEAATRATGSQNPEWRRWARRFRADARRALGDAAGAIEDRLEALAGSAEVAGATTDPVLVLDLGDDFLAADRVSEAAEAGEMALRLLGRDGRPDLVERARLQLLGGYRRLDEPALALEQVLALADDVTDETPLLWRAQLTGEQGSLLLWLSRWTEARTALVEAATAYAAADDPGGQVRSLRQAQAAALESGAREEAADLWEQAMRASERLSEETSERWFQQGWLWVERAALDLQTGDRDAAAVAFDRAESTFHRGAFGDQATEAVLRRAEGLGADLEELRAIFVGVERSSEAWFRSGWLLVDALDAGGQEAESTRLTAELEAAAAGGPEATS